MAYNNICINNCSEVICRFVDKFVDKWVTVSAFSLAPGYKSYP